MRWNQGRSEIEALIAKRHITRVTPSRDFADTLIASARAQLASAALAQNDPETAYDALYSGARKALIAILENQGLRATTSGGHIAPYQAVLAQLDPPLADVIWPFDGMRRQRHAVDYPTANTRRITAAHVRADLPIAAGIIDLAERVLDQMSPF